MPLMETVIEWNVLKKDGDSKWEASCMLSGCSVYNGILTYEYSSFLKGKLTHPKMYARINLVIQSKFKSKYSLALYELCIDYK